MGEGEAVGEGEEAVGEGEEVVGEGEAVDDGDAVTDGEGDAEAVGRAVEGGGLLECGVRLGPGELTVTTGTMADRGPGAGDVDGAWAGWVPRTAGADGAAADVGKASAPGATRAADERGGGPPSAKLTATDAASRAAVTPAAVSGRHQRRPGDRPGGAAGLGEAPGDVMAPRVAPGSQPGTG